MVEQNTVSKDFTCGRKVISVSVNVARSSASIRIGTTDAWWRKKEVGETTNVYLKADSFIQDMSDKDGKDIHLAFDTADDNMKIWVRTRKNMLRFDSVEPENVDSYRITVNKTFLPARRG